MIADSRWFVACDHCDYEFSLEVSSTRDFTTPVYDFGSGILLPLLKERHWCLDCNTIEWVEVIPSEARIQNEIERYEKQVEDFDSGKYSWIGGNLAGHYRNVIRDRNRWSKWATARGQGRCLRCGCQKTVPLDLSKLTEEGKDLNLTHPGCGGRLLGKTEVLDYHANPRRWNGDAPLDFVRFTPQGFPDGDLRKKAEEEFPEIIPGMFAAVASEARAALAPGRRRRQGAIVRTEDEFPEIFESVRAFTRAEIAGEVIPPYNEKSLSYDFPELHGMFCPEARRIIAVAKAEALAAAPSGAKKSRLAEARINPLRRNSFAVLGATVRDDRRKIVELAEEKSLTADPDECARARSELTNPSKRLSAEVAWLPGLSPKQAEKMLLTLETDVDFVRNEASLPSMACANLVAAAIEKLAPETDADLWFEWLEELAYASQEINAEEVLRDVNEDRSVSGFPVVQSVDQVEAELSERRRNYAETVRNALEELDSDKMVSVVTKLVDASTQSGETHAPQLVHDVIERYETEALRFLEPEAENIKKIVESVRNSAPRGEGSVVPLVEKLDKMLRNWDFVAQPIQLSAKAQGFEHSLSSELAWAVRGLAVDLFNKHDMLSSAKKLSSTLRILFSELPEIVDKLDDDVATLGEISEKRADNERRTEEWAREITYTAEVGLVFKDELRVSPEGLSWKGRCYPLEEITRVRWGGVRNSVNGISTGTDYTIGFGDNRSATDVSLRREAIYSKFLECMWRAVCVRLLFQIGEELKGGKKFVFGDIEVEDDAVTLVRRKLFGANEKVKFGWHDVSVWSASGSFVIGRKEDSKTYASASYIESWNTHLLEHIVRGGFKKGVRRLSDYFKD